MLILVEENAVWGVVVRGCAFVCSCPWHNWGVALHHVVHCFDSVHDHAGIHNEFLFPELFVIYCRLPYRVPRFAGVKRGMASC